MRPSPCRMAAGDCLVLAGITGNEGWDERVVHAELAAEHPPSPSPCVTMGGMDPAITRAVPHTFSKDAPTLPVLPAPLNPVPRAVPLRRGAVAPPVLGVWLGRDALCPPPGFAQPL